ncbi:ganglioside-induced differentiation-associated protein 2-like [Megalops cyprinoides]|uniref:ganglioside-induced differentiation-associated protein 2-like n=1 Tax=Megalops cyprinoides TaxID=118141 RepID=UPI001864F884|nr:ganglioside-induced differentiation-associated protein 2-like [Megalops cyprinoides]
MDPLGARPRFVDIRKLPSWAQSKTGLKSSSGTRDHSHSLTNQHGVLFSPFPFREDINRKIILFTGDVGLLNCTAIVNTSNEVLSERNPVSDNIHRLAGPKLREELLKLTGCGPGEVKMTEGFDLPARFIIHTVGPKYRAKYRTAAETALYNCYRNALQLVREEAMTSIAFCVISTAKRGYPLEDATHIALRTVRRFLESHGASLEAVVFVVAEGEEPVYRKLLPLYYPRSREEERSSLALLPRNVGNSEGAPVVPDRQIRITDKPGSMDEDSDDGTLGLGLVGRHAFARMEGDVDKQRKLHLQGQRSQAALHRQALRNYSRWLRRARTEDLSHIAALKALYQTGVDRYGRPVMVIVGRNIPGRLIDMEKALLYFIHVVDPIAVKEYVIVYFHTLTRAHNRLHSDFLKKLYDTVDPKFKKNLRAFYFVHPTFRSKVCTWFFTTFSVSDLKEKVQQVQSLRQLFNYIVPEQIDIPAFILEYDAQINRRYRPTHYSGL